MDAITHALPRLDHTDLPLGVGFILTLCGFGPADDPKDLTGLPAALLITTSEPSTPQRLELTLEGEWVRVPVDDVAWLGPVVSYVLLLGEAAGVPPQPVLTGTLTGSRAMPYA